jgi:hypothetical protein
MALDATKPNESESQYRAFDLAEALPTDLDQIDFSSLSKIEIVIPLPSCKRGLETADQAAAAIGC